MASAYMTTKQVCKHYGGISPRTLHRWRDQKHYSNPFPAPAMAANGSQNRWRTAEVLAWEEAGGLGEKLHTEEDEKHAA